MTIQLTKFGTVLTSRQSGREAYAAFLPTLKQLPEDEDVQIEFEGLTSFSPSCGDEFLTPLQKKFGDRLTLLHLTNPSVALTLTMLEEIHRLTFNTE